MKKWATGAVLVCALASCGGGTSNPKTSEADPETITLVSLKDNYKDAKATKMDVIFDDFLITFATDSLIQWSRTRFPLFYRVRGKTEKITPDRWKMDGLFSNENIYTVIFNAEEDIELPTRTDLKEGLFEWIMPKEGTIKQYCFKRNDHRAWTLDSISQFPIAQSSNADFLQFYGHFATDSSFRKKHISDPVTFVTNFTDNDDGFGTDRFLVDAEQWMAWEVPMPIYRLSNIIYGPSPDKGRKQELKILCIKALDGAFFKALYFRKHKTGWQLYQYEDTAY